MSEPRHPAEVFAGHAQALPALGLAVSGGGDSMAMLALAEEWSDLTGKPIAAVTVDHGLRAESAAEAARVAMRCAGLGIPHDILRWDGWDGRGNLAEAARDARRALVVGWARARGLGTVALAHTLEDQAETVLMRLARGSGVAGLAAMSVHSKVGDIAWLRPLLGVRREALRDVLRRRGWGWDEDPSNDDLSRDRVKARAMLETLAPLGLTPERLALTARHMRDARDALDVLEGQMARTLVSFSRYGEARLDWDVLVETGEPATSHQLLADLLTVTGGQRHPPRLENLESLCQRMSAPDAAASLHGCLVRRRGAFVHVRREPARVAPPVPLADGVVWDRRWRIAGPVTPGLTVGALGADANALADPPLRPAGLLATTPAIRDGERLVAVPLLAPAEWTAERHIPDARRRRLLGGL